MTSTQPIKAYFAGGLLGDSRWWTWLAGFWFAVMVWVIGQTLIGIPMVLAIMFGPEGQDFQQAMNDMTAGESGNAALSTLSGLALFILPFIATLAYLIKDKFDEGGRNFCIIIAAASAIISALAFVYSMATSPQEMNTLITRQIANSPFIYLCILLFFPPMAIGLFLAQKFIHKRAILPLLTAARKYRWRRMFFAMGVFWMLAGILTLISHLAGWNDVQVVFNAKRFFIYAAISLCFIPLQSATEEIMLRGYLNQGLGKYIKNPWIVFFITSAAFAALHAGNPEALEGKENGQFILTMSAYFFFGFFACIMTYIDGGLESAIGMHAANNLYASMILGYDNSALPTPTVFKIGLNPTTDSIGTIILLTLCCLILWKFRPKLPAVIPLSEDEQTFS